MSEETDLRHKIRNFVIAGNISFSNHAGDRMVEMNISLDDVLKLIMTGDIIEKQPECNPCPKVLILGYDRSGSLYHVSVAICKGQLKIITVYRPDEDKWINGRVRI